MLKRRLKQAGLPALYSPHSFRATGITNFLENGGILEAAQRIAGHADSRTTKLYDRRGQKVLLETTGLLFSPQSRLLPSGCIDHEQKRSASHHNVVAHARPSLFQTGSAQGNRFAFGIQRRIPPALVLVEVEGNKIAQALGTVTGTDRADSPSGVQHSDKFFETSRFTRCLSE
jgi:hypothetical protein